MRLKGGPAPLLPGGPPRVETLSGWIDPLDALRSVRGRARPVLLYSGLAGRHPEARHSILACDPVAEIAVRTGTIRITTRDPRDPESRAGTRAIPAADPFAALRDLLPAASPPSGLPFAGGAIGYLGYGLRGAVERLGRASADPLDLPDAWFGVYDAALVFDHDAGAVSAVRLGPGPAPWLDAPGSWRPGRADGADDAGPERDASGVASVTAPPRAARTGTPRSDYEAAVRDVLARIARGDLYQVNLSHRITAPLAHDPADLFARLMRDNPAPFSAFLDGGAWQLLSASPERFVALRGDEARSSPIKGTRPRGAFPEEDLLHAGDLKESVKDRAENVMIADLVRNDLGRVCRPGSVVVEDLCRLESFATVHHLVTTVRGRLRADRDRFDLLRALFPGGSMTGAPKVAAMQAIAALEKEERGAYSGAIGYLSCDGGIDFNIVIRTLACGQGRAHFRVGGGIVADSDPEREWIETLDKGRALLEVLGARLAAGAASQDGP